MTDRRQQAIPDRKTLERTIDDIRRDQRRVSLDDIIIDGSRRILLRSPNGHYWSIGASNAGAMTLTDLGTNPL